MLLRPHVSLILALSAVPACTLSNPGTPPPAQEFHFPIALAVSADSNHLYVVNSDFNLQYNGGVVQTVDLAAVREEIQRCGGSCPVSFTPGAEARFVQDAVRINPFAVDAGLRAGRAGEGARLYVLVRGDGTLTYIDIASDGVRLDCGQSRDNTEGTLGLCDAAHRIGDDPSESPRGLTLPPLPTAMNIDPDGFITVVHQESPRARMTLLFDPPERSGVPRLLHWLADLPPNLSATLRLNPNSGPGEEPFWFVASRETPVVASVHAFRDGERSFLYSSRSTTLPGLASDVGVRAIVRDPHAGRARAYATARPGTPASGQSTRSGEQLLDIDISNPIEPVVRNVMEIPVGASHLVAIDDPARTGHTLVYAVSYDARKVYVVDADDWTTVAQIQTQLGPHAIVADPSLAEGYSGPVHPYLYLVDFAAATIEVIDVGAASNHRNEVVFTIGDPTRPRETL